MWKVINKSEADTVFKEWENGKKVAPCSEELKDLYIDLKSAFGASLTELGLKEDEVKNSSYKFDLIFGLKIYMLLNSKYKFNARLASNDGVWRLLSVHGAPDLVFKRWGLNKSRYFGESRRIWFKSLWWYIHLSWQGDMEATYKVLENNTTDEIVQMVERSGPSGYRIELCRNIMLCYSRIPSKKKNRNTNIFRKVMKLNTARTRVVEPALTTGGEAGYAKELFKYFGENIS